MTGHIPCSDGSDPIGCVAATCRHPSPAAIAPTEHIQFQVGQIVHHVRYDYRGVIVGVDAVCQADDDWYELQTKGKDYKPTRKQPWYHVLVDGTVNQTYVAQQNLREGDGSRPIDHPMVEHVFVSFLGGRYYRQSLN